MDIVLSIIIPVYNVKKYLHQCLHSLIPLFDQKYIEIIVVDDGSTDGSDKILESFSKDYPIKIITQENRGLSSARNSGFRIATGEYIAFIDSDDYIDANKLLSILQIATDSKADIVIGNYFEFSEQDSQKSLESSLIKADKHSLNNGIDFFSEYYIQLKSVVWRNVYRRSLLIANRIEFHEGVSFEDVEFTPIAFSRATSVIYTGIFFYYYRRRSDSITTSRSSLKKIQDAISIWHSLNLESYKLDNLFVSCLFRELGFHCFIVQYANWDKSIPIESLNHAKSLCRSRMKSPKYIILSILFRILPTFIFHKLLQCKCNRQ